MIQVYGLTAYRKELKGIVRDVRVTWLLEELGLPYERVVMDPMKGENKTDAYLKLNPTGKVPTIVDGDFSLFESGAICQYLAEKHGRLVPERQTPAYWTSQQWCYFVLTNVEPNCARFFGADIILEKGESATKIRELASEQLNRFFKVLDARLKENAYLVGPDFMLADLYLTSTLCYISHSELLAPYENLRRYFEACKERPAFQKAFKDNGLAS